jgi:hypothetical protein
MTKFVNMLIHAKAYAGEGLPVFPLHHPIENGACSCRNPTCDKVGKHPMTAHGLKDATTDRISIERWWSADPLANIGIPTGLASGFIVLDVDDRHNGTESLRMLEQKIGPMPTTLISRTGDGRHLLYRCLGYALKNGVAVLGPGIDIRGDGGYIVVPPSLHANGKRYEWVRGGIDDTLSR